MKFYRTQNGFTLVETLVAITVLLLAISGPLTIATNGLSATHAAKDQLTANLLAQEGIELVRWQRDSNVLSSLNWLDSFNQCSTEDGCVVDSAERVFMTCSGECKPIKYSETVSLYVYDAGEDSVFTRKVRYEPISGIEIRVISEVTWMRFSNTKTFVLEESLFNWQQ